MKVLVVIPTYNESKTIKKIVQKIFIIDKEYSILVVDDSSPDGTREIVEELQFSHSNLFILNRSKRKGSVLHIVQVLNGQLIKVMIK